MQQMLTKNRKQQLKSYKGAYYLNSLPPEKIEELLLFSESDHFCALLPSSLQKKTLFLNDQRHKFLFKKVLAHEPRFFLNLVYGAEVEDHGPTHFTIQGDLHNLPLKKGFFDCVICPFVLQTEKVTTRRIQVLSQLLKNGGRLVFSVRHPGLEKILCNQDLSTNVVPENSVSRYFNWLKENHLFTEEMTEGCVDNKLKPFFDVEGGIGHFEEYKNTPMTLLFRAVKFAR